jgi:predicted AAA+ superfamily ATPase
VGGSTQLVHSAAAYRIDARVSTLRTEHGAEVDFIVERGADVFAIECKASRTVAASDLRGFDRFADCYGTRHRRTVWYLGKDAKRLGDVDILPWQQGLTAIGW